MSQVARPVCDVTRGGWRPPPVYAAIDEPAPDDGDFVASPGGPAGDAFEVKLGPVCRPVTGPHRLRVRMRASTLCSKLARIELLQGGGCCVGEGCSSSSSGSSSSCGTAAAAVASRMVAPRFAFADYVLELRPDEVDRITDYHDLRLRVTAYQDLDCSSGGSSSSGSSRSSSSSSVSSRSSWSSSRSVSRSTSSQSGTSTSPSYPPDSCGQLPQLYVTVTGSVLCGICNPYITFPGLLTGTPLPCTWEFTAASGLASECAVHNRGYGIRLTFDLLAGTVGVTNPGDYCGPPDMTVTPASWSPFYLAFSYTGGKNCCDPGTMNVVITE